METTGVIVFGLYLVAGGAAWAWIGWRRRRRTRPRATTRRRQSEYPLVAGFLLLLTWPLALWEEVRGRK
jgi:hypothetical protein